MITLRLGNEHQSNTTLLNELICELKLHPNACDEVWFASEYGFPPLEVHKKEAELISEAAKCFGDVKNVRTSLQISNTIGHGEYMKSKDCSGLIYEGSNAENMVGPNGEVAQYCFCWRGENFREYTYQVIQMYSKFKPHTVWFDDDLRTDNHAPVQYGCFCDNCITEFNNKYNQNFTRKALVEVINYGDIVWRERWIKFTREGIADFATMAANAVLSVSPDSFLGYQYALCSHYSGNDANHIFDALSKASGRKVKSRPGGGAYDDHNPNALVEKAMFMAYDNSKAPEYVSEFRPEIENTPDVAFGKSNYGTCLESSLYLSCGNNALSYATLMNKFEPMSWHGKMFGMFEAHKPYWKRLIDCSNNGRNGGLFIENSPNACLKPLSKDDAPFAWTKMTTLNGIEFLRVGLPLCYNKDAACASLLLSDAVDGLSDNDIEELLKKPVVTDAFALKKLSKRGFSAKIGMDVEDLNFCFYQQRYTSHAINTGVSCDTWLQSPFGINKGGKMLIDQTGNCEVLSEFVTITGGKYTGIADAIVTTSHNAKWAIFGYNLRDNVISFDKRNQILKASDCLCGKSIPAILEAPYQVAVFPMVDKNGKTISVSLLNCSIADTEELSLIIRNPISEHFDNMNDQMLQENLEFEKVSDGYKLKLPPIRGWRITTVFLK